MRTLRQLFIPTTSQSTVSDWASASCKSQRVTQPWSSQSVSPVNLWAPPEFSGSRLLEIVLIREYYLKKGETSFFKTQENRGGIFQKPIAPYVFLHKVLCSLVTTSIFSVSFSVSWFLQCSVPPAKRDHFTPDWRELARSIQRRLRHRLCSKLREESTWMAQLVSGVLFHPLRCNQGALTGLLEVTLSVGRMRIEGGHDYPLRGRVDSKDCED